MAIKAEVLKGAFAPFAEIKKQESVAIDLGKVAMSIVDDTNAVAKADDPEKAVEEFRKKLDEVDAFLATCVAGEEEVFAAKSETSERFAKEWPPKKKPAMGDMDCEDEEKAKGKKKADAAPAKTKKADEAEGGDEDRDAVEEKLAKAEDGEGWQADMAPRKSPARKAERLTKAERPIPARAGSRKAADKYQRARDRAMGRDDGRSTRE